MDRACTPPPLHAERRAGRDVHRFFKKKRTSNQEGGPPQMLRGELLIIQHLPNVAGSAADRSTFFLLNGIVGDGPRARSTFTSRRARWDDHRFFKKKSGLQIKKADLGCLGAGFWSFIPCCRMWLAAPRIDHLSFCSTA